jgi:hypothetical protein
MVDINTKRENSTYIYYIEIEISTQITLKLGKVKHMYNYLFVPNCLIMALLYVSRIM